MIERNRTTADCCTSDNEAGELDTLHENRPSLPTLSYRLGRHGDFFERMLTRLPSQRTDGDPSRKAPLDRLTYRGADDATVAVLDACASMLDVLSFYQERIVNEGFVRTALERRSVLELARSIGYEMNPGVAASTLLSFTIDESPDTTDIVTVPTGTQVLSIPKKDESPKTYETIETIEARPEWNSIAVSVEPTPLIQTIGSETLELFIDRSGPRIRPGDPLLIVGTVPAPDTGPEAIRMECLVRKVSSVEDMRERGYRRVALQGLGPDEVPDPDEPLILTEPRLYAFRKRSNLFGHNAPEPVSRSVDTERVASFDIDTKVKCVALSPDGKIAAAGFTAVDSVPDSSTEQELSTIRIWNVAEPCEQRWLAVTETITALAFSADGAYLASGDDGGVIRIWDMTTDDDVANNDDAVSPPSVAALFFGDPQIGTYEPPPANLLASVTNNDIGGNLTHLWHFTPGDMNPESPRPPDLRPLEDVITTTLALEPRIARNGESELEGKDDGIVVYRLRTTETPEALPDKVPLEDGRVDLARVQSTLVPGGWSLLIDPEQTRAYPVDSVSVIQREDFGLRRRISRMIVELDAGSETPAYSLRQTDVYTESVELPFAEIGPRLPEPIDGDSVLLSGIELDEDMAVALQGRTVILQGRPAGRKLVDDHAEYLARLGEDALLPGESSEVYRFPITAMADDGSLVSFTVEQDQASSQWRLVDENGLILELPEQPDVSEWNDDDDVIEEAAKVTLASVSPPKLTFAEELQNAYDWRTVRIFANVASATHGETIVEVLGSGDGLVPNQGFRLKKPPLTYVPAANERGSATTLEVRVNSVVWRESDSLLMTRPTDETFIVRLQDNGATEITFGDGMRGARLPSGAENITARYRSGIGLDGELDAGQLSLLKTRPLGVSEVTNPLPATGGAAAEKQSEARDNAPRTVLVLGRVVSVQDYEDFSKSFPGVGKARAVAMWDGATKLVHLTVGTESGQTVERASPLYDSLLGALDKVRDVNQLVVIDGFVPIHFGLCARVLVDERYLAELVIDAVKRHLAEKFAYDRRSFGQNIAASEIVAAIHEVEGVVAVDLDALYRVEDPPDDDTPAETADSDDSEPEPYCGKSGLADGFGDTAPTQRLEARTARLEGGQPQAAELLLIRPDHVSIEEMS